MSIICCYQDTKHLRNFAKHYEKNLFWRQIILGKVVDTDHVLAGIYAPLHDWFVAFWREFNSRVVIGCLFPTFFVIGGNRLQGIITWGFGWTAIYLSVWFRTNSCSFFFFTSFSFTKEKSGWNGCIRHSNNYFEGVIQVCKRLTKLETKKSLATFLDNKFLWAIFHKPTYLERLIGSLHFGILKINFNKLLIL